VTPEDRRFLEGKLEETQRQKREIEQHFHVQSVAEVDVSLHRSINSLRAILSRLVGLGGMAKKV
jgi:hypothetical protein